MIASLSDTVQFLLTMGKAWVEAVMAHAESNTVLLRHYAARSLQQLNIVENRLGDGVRSNLPAISV